MAGLSVPPTDASPAPLRATAHGAEPMWLATPSSYRICTDYSLPVSRAQRKLLDTPAFECADGPERANQHARRLRANSRPRRAKWSGVGVPAPPLPVPFLDRRLELAVQIATLRNAIRQDRLSVD